MWEGAWPSMARQAEIWVIEHTGPNMGPRIGFTCTDDSLSLVLFIQTVKR